VWVDPHTLHLQPQFTEASFVTHVRR
jgi:hypothetical protein